MRTYFILLCSSLSGIISHVFAQTGTSTFTGMISKEWELASYGNNNRKQAPSPKQQEDRLIFYKDQRILCIEKGVKQSGSWEYDTALKQLTIRQPGSEPLLLQVLQLDQERFTAGYKDPAGTLLEIHMLPVKH